MSAGNGGQCATAKTAFMAIAAMHVCADGRALSSILRDRARDGVVEAPVQYAKVPDADRSARFHGEVGDGLADVAVVMHHLRHGESLQLQITPVLGGASVNRQVRPEVIAQGVAKSSGAAPNSSSAGVGGGTTALFGGSVESCGGTVIRAGHLAWDRADAVALSVLGWRLLSRLPHRTVVGAPLVKLSPCAHRGSVSANQGSAPGVRGTAPNSPARGDPETQPSAFTQPTSTTGRSAIKERNRRLLQAIGDPPPPDCRRWRSWPAVAHHLRHVKVAPGW